MALRAPAPASSAKVAAKRAARSAWPASRRLPRAGIRLAQGRPEDSELPSRYRGPVEAGRVPGRSPRGTPASQALRPRPRRRRAGSREPTTRPTAGVVSDVPDCAHVGGDHRRAAGQRLENDIGPALARRAQQQRVGGRVELGQLRLRHGRAGSARRCGHAGDRHAPRGCAAQGPFSDHHERGVRQAGAAPRWPARSPSPGTRLPTQASSAPAPAGRGAARVALAIAGWNTLGIHTVAQHDDLRRSARRVRPARPSAASIRRSPRPRARRPTGSSCPGPACGPAR